MVFIFEFSFNLSYTKKKRRVSFRLYVLQKTNSTIKELVFCNLFTINHATSLRFTIPHQNPFLCYNFF